MIERSKGSVGPDAEAWIPVRSSDDFDVLRGTQLESSPYWWPEIGPLASGGSFSFIYRMRRISPITVLDANFHNDICVDGGELRPHYHVTLPVAASSAARRLDLPVVTEPSAMGVYLPEGKANVPHYSGRLLAVMIDRQAVENTLAQAIGRPVAAQIDLQPSMQATKQAVRAWISLVSMFTTQLFQPNSILQQPLVAAPFAESLVRGLLLATDHSYRATLESEVITPSPAVIRTAIEVMEAEADNALTVSALAARCCVSVRSLQEGFQRHLATTPMAYLREVRLRRAHQTLLYADPSTVSVASVAYRWGFSNLGRFAAAHTARYGEAPSMTLRNGSQQ
jgi:AraC-like DNA-binding protein